MNNLQAPSKLILKNQGGRLDKSTAERIALLSQMNRRHKVALNNRSKRALQRLANEYDVIGCPRLANLIRIEAKSIVLVKKEGQS